jgi:hypothetical protein
MVKRFIVIGQSAAKHLNHIKNMKDEGSTTKQGWADIILILA